jgi:hypothetical protein
MWEFFKKTFLKNPKGLIVLGVVVTIALGVSLGKPKTSPGLDIFVFVLGIIAIVIGIIWLVIRSRKEKSAIAANTPFYLRIIDNLKKSGYVINEFEHKKDLIRSTVYLGENLLGEVFLVAPPPSGKYAMFRRIEDNIKINFQRAYVKKNGKNPGIPVSYWPNNSLVGAIINESADNYSEKEKWLKTMESIFQEK